MTTLRFEVVTIFPALLDAIASAGLLSKAVAGGLLSIECENPRGHATDRHRSVDDSPYGGGSGMVMLPVPLLAAIAALDARADAAQRPRARRILMTPQGKPFTQAHAQRLAAEPALMLVCGRYEGVDERVREVMDEELSLGDFVLNGGETAAMAVIESVGRLLPGVLGNRESLEEESHAAGLLEYPQYTRPRELGGRAVPEVLLSGDHARIARYRRRQALLRTRARRPDLFEALTLDRKDRALLDHDGED